LIARESFDDEEKESGAWNGNRIVSERSRNEAAVEFPALSGGEMQQRGLDGRTACGDGCEGTGQHGDEKKIFFFFFFLSLSGQIQMLESLRGWLLFFIRPFHQNPPFRPLLLI